MNKPMLYLEGLFEGFAANAEDAVFEWQHFKDVSYYAQLLAHSRQLDVEIASLIAYGHDAGRTHGGIHGKLHAKESAKVLKQLLVDKGYANLYQKKEMKIVLRAIKNHSKKDQIDDVYSELIKDADTLAHIDEQLKVDVNGYEFTRYLALKSHIQLDQVASIHDWVRIFFKLNGHLNVLWNEGFSTESQDEWVHQVRTTTRKLRSIITIFSKTEYYFDEPSFKSILKEYETKLKQILKHLEAARRLAVFINMEAYDVQKKKLDTLYQIELEHIKKLLKDDTIELDRTLKLSFNCIDTEQWIKSCNGIINQQIVRYIKRVSKLELENDEKIHFVRVKGKQLKYLFELGLISNANKHLYDMIKEFHDISGELHDLKDAMNYKHSAHYFDTKTLEKKQKNDLIRLKKTIFYFKLV